MEIINILLLLCIISIVVYVVTSKVEKLDLIDTSDNNPLISGIKNMKSGFDKLGDFVKMLDNGAQQVLGDIKKAFDPKPVVLDPCPDDSYDVAGTCWKHNYKNSWGKTDCNGPQRDPVYTWGSEGCDGPKNDPQCNYSWGCGTLLAKCHDGSTGCKNDCYKTCWGWKDCYRSWNDCYTSDFPYVYKNIGDRGSSCPYEKHTKKVKELSLCYIP